LQTSYSYIRKRGIIGQRTDSGPGFVISKLSKPTDKIPFATLVIWDGDNLCRPPATNEDTEKAALGVALADSKGAFYPPSATVSILRQGRVRVEAQSDIEKPGSDVYVRFQSAGDNSAIGGFSAKEEVGVARLRGAIFLEAARKGEGVEMEIDLMGGRS
jgi:hypothetical protein